MSKVSPLPLFLLSLVFLPLLTVLSAVLVGAAGVYSGGAAAIQSLLQDHGLPAGLLPKTVQSFTLDTFSGALEVQLAGPCYAIYNGDGLAYFEPIVRGNLSFGALGGVVGWSQVELFVWLPVKGILVANPASGVILLDIGLAHKRLSASVFEEPPDCRLPEIKQSEFDRQTLIKEVTLGRGDGLHFLGAAEMKDYKS